MKFQCDGREWDTLTMTPFQTGNRAMPWIYLSADGDVFIQKMDRILGVEIVRATPQQIRHLANLYNLPGLFAAPSTTGNVGDGDGAQATEPPPDWP